MSYLFSRLLGSEWHGARHMSPEINVHINVHRNNGNTKQWKRTAHLHKTYNMIINNMSNNNHFTLVLLLLPKPINEYKDWPLPNMITKQSTNLAFAFFGGYRQFLLSKQNRWIISTKWMINMIITSNNKS